MASTSASIPSTSDSGSTNSVNNDSAVPPPTPIPTPTPVKSTGDRTSVPSPAPGAGAGAGSGTGSGTGTGTGTGAAPVKSNRERIKLTNTSTLLLNVKKRLAWNLCSDLLYPPISALGALKYDEGDSETTKELKAKEYEEKKAEIEQQKAEREPELLNKLDEIVERVIVSRSEKPVDNEEAWATRGGAVGGEKASALSGIVCDLCGNKTHFIEDMSSGDTICLGRDGEMSCGKVVQDHKVFEGVEKRNFEDDDKDRHQHGPEANPFMPDSENMRTYIASSGTDAASKALSKELNRIHQRVEDNLSSIGNDERRTRTATRSRQKRDAFDIMSRACSSLGIHRVVLDKANEEFARYRDVREHVHNFHAVVAACMLLAYERILSEGGHVQATFEVDAQTNKFFGEDKVAFGGLGSVPQSLLSAEDVAISSLKELPMGKWNSIDLRNWLTGVLEARNSTDLDVGTRDALHMTLVDKLVDYVEDIRNRDKVDDGSSKKRKYPTATPSFFGSTTMSHRNKKFYMGGKGANQGPLVTKNTSPALRGTANVASKLNSSMTSGQIFIRMNLGTVLGGSALRGSTGIEGVTETQIECVITAIRCAMKTRTVYDAAVKEKSEIEEKEARRHMAENSSRFLVLNKSTAGEMLNNKLSATPLRSQSDAPVKPPRDTSPNDEEETDDMLLEMLSADQSGAENLGNEEGMDCVKDSADVDEYDVYNTLRQEERSRNSMMRFKVRR